MGTEKTVQFDITRFMGASGSRHCAEYLEPEMSAIPRSLAMLACSADKWLRNGDKSSAPRYSPGDCDTEDPAALSMVARTRFVLTT